MQFGGSGETSVKDSRAVSASRYRVETHLAPSGCCLFPVLKMDLEDSFRYHGGYHME
jgi:hypothetical protein